MYILVYIKGTLERHLNLYQISISLSQVSFPKEAENPTTYCTPLAIHDLNKHTITTISIQEAFENFGTSLRMKGTSSPT
jgi:hypothetical protein